VISEDYKVGYGRPPEHTRFKKGQCPNPKGRGGKKQFFEKAAFRKMLNADVPYIANGKRCRGSRVEMLVRRRIADALKGDVSAALELLRMRSYFTNMTTDNVDILVFSGGVGPKSDARLMKVSDSYPG
jgi:hypothetical protein